MMIMVLGLMLLILGLISLILIIKKKSSYKASINALVTIFITSSIFSLSRLIRYYVKGYETSPYRIWFAISLLTILFGAYIYNKVDAKAKEMDD